MNIQRLIRSAIVGKKLTYWRLRSDRTYNTTFNMDEVDRYEKIQEKVIHISLYNKKTGTWRDREFTKGVTWVLELESGVEIGVNYELDDFEISD